MRLWPNYYSEHKQSATSLLLLVVVVATTAQVAFAFGVPILSSSKLSAIIKVGKPKDQSSMQIMNEYNCNKNNVYGQESMEPLMSNNIDTDTDNCGDGEQTRRGGRPGIVVFSGGTAFNAASAEMASRVISGSNNVESSSYNDKKKFVDVSEKSISRSNSMSSLMDMMALGSMIESSSEMNTNSNSNINVGGIKVWHVLPVTDDGGEFIIFVFYAVFDLHSIS